MIRESEVLKWSWAFNSKTTPLGPVQGGSPAVVTENGKTAVYIVSSLGLYKLDTNGNVVWAGPLTLAAECVTSRRNYGANAVILEAASPSLDKNCNQRHEPEPIISRCPLFEPCPERWGMLPASSS